MNVLILGRNTINAQIEKKLFSKGIAAVVIEDAQEIVKFKGEPGNYTVTTTSNRLSFTSVIITEAPQFEGIRVGNGISINIMDDNEIAMLDNLKINEKIAILLDYDGETPEYISARAFFMAKKLAEKKKNIVFLSKVIKSGYGGNELKYREARDAGVTFVKYESLTLCHDEETDIFKIQATDGIFDININTPYLISVVCKEDAQLKNICKKLCLYNQAEDRINSDKFFLYPAFTTRRGIYYLNPALDIPQACGNNSTSYLLEQPMISIIEDMAVTEEKSYTREITRGIQFPEVDSNKCAFCYCCFRACPHSALLPDIEASAMRLAESQCQSCGICIAICPGQAIKRKGFADKPAVNGDCKIYCCENGAAQAFAGAIPLLGEHARRIDCERVACGGSVGADKLADDFKDYQTLIVACCIEDACRHMEGDRRACKQSGRTMELLAKAGLEKKYVHVIKVSGSMSGVMKDNILSVLEEQT